MNDGAIRTFDQLPSDSLTRPTILIVDDDPHWRKLVQGLLKEELSDQAPIILERGDIPGALMALSSQLVHVVILDKHLGPDANNPNENGVATVPRFLAIQDHLQIVMATSSDEIQDVVEAMRGGAAGYIVKHKEAGLLVEMIRKALRDALQTLRVRQSSENQNRTRSFDLVGSSPAIQLLRARINEMAKADAPVLLLGETGTGKTTAARLLHDLRNQYLKLSDRPFVHLNMAAIPETLAESELFGSEAGAFTDAKKLKIGAFEQVKGGTLFLDEIGEASLALQAKLLTVLDRGIFRRVGGTQEIQSQFRLICATNQNLEQLVREKKFREDLYRRISVIEIRIPSLSERKEDFHEIIKAVLPRCCKQTSVYVDPEDIPKDFIASLAHHPPAGNIRGIEQQLCRLFLYAPRDKKNRPILKRWRFIEGLNMNPGDSRKLPDHPLTLEDLLSKPLDVVGSSDFMGITKFLKTIEKKLYEDARRKLGTDYGTNRQIARALRVTDQTVGLRLKHFGLMTEKQSASTQRSHRGSA